MNKSPKEYAEELVNNFYDYCNNSRVRDAYAVECAKLCINQMREFGAKNNLREPLIYLNMTETELNKILKEL
jgi:hypothetical protein